MSEVEVHEATPDESRQIAVEWLQKAIECLRDGDDEHAAVWVESAKIWMRGA